MSVIRKLQFNRFIKGYYTVVPKQLVEALGWKKKDSFKFTVDGKNLIMSPETKTESG